MYLRGALRWAESARIGQLIPENIRNSNFGTGPVFYCFFKAELMRFALHSRQPVGSDDEHLQVDVLLHVLRAFGDA